MTSLRSSLVGSAVGLSSAELRRTSMADKQWLSISEEQLINEIFTDEFYHRLHDPANIWFSQDDMGHEDIESSSSNAQTSSEDIFLRYLLRSVDNLELGTTYIPELLQDLLQVCFV